VQTAPQSIDSEVAALTQRLSENPNAQGANRLDVEPVEVDG
jgi:hypothetical protein